MPDKTLPAAAGLAGYTLWLLAFPMGGALLAGAGGPGALVYFLVPHVAALYATSRARGAAFERWSAASGALAVLLTAAFPLRAGDAPALLIAVGLLSGPVGVRAGVLLRRAPDPPLQAALALVAANLLLAGLGALPLPRAIQFGVAALALGVPCLLKPERLASAPDEAGEPGASRELLRVLPFFFVFHLVSGLFYGSLMPAYERVRVVPAVELLFYVVAVLGARTLMRRSTRAALPCAIVLGMVSLGAFQGEGAVRVHVSMFAMQASAGFMDLFVLLTLLRHAEPVRAFGLGLGTMCLGILGGNVASRFAGALPGGVAVLGSMALNLALLTLYGFGRRIGEAPRPAAEPPAGRAPESDAPGRLPPGLRARLSAMERSVLEEVLEGRTFKEAAATLSVSESSVKTYMKRIYEKAEVSGKGALLEKLSRPPGSVPRQSSSDAA